MSPKKKTPFSKLNIDDQVKAVQEALADEVMPALEMDGGGLEIMDIEGNTVYIRYYGACATCPLGGTGTLMFIQDTLQKKVDEAIEVQIV